MSVSSLRHAGEVLRVAERGRREREGQGEGGEEARIGEHASEKLPWRGRRGPRHSAGWQLELPTLLPFSRARAEKSLTPPSGTGTDLQGQLRPPPAAFASPVATQQRATGASIP